MSASIPVPGPAAAPAEDEFTKEEEARIMVASQWQLIWWKFRRHKLAMISGAVVLFIYTVALFAEFFAPYAPDQYAATYTYAPPQPLHFIDNSSGGTKLGMFANGYKVTVDQVSLRRIFVIDPTIKLPVRFFAHGWSYKLLGIIPLDIHLIGPANKGDTVFLIGADSIGEDMLSRVVFGTRVSMSIGLLGVSISLILGVLLGGISGYYGGTIDNVIQRVIEFLRSLPTIPLWMGLAAALPPRMPAIQVYFGITIILSLIGWTGLARVVRGRFLALREEDFVLAARLDGSSEIRTITRHMVPSFTSHIIASITLAIPGMILSETALSFLGLGLRPPVVSWGVLLQNAQNIRAVATAPWLMLPGLAVVVAVLSLNFLGDGLRDAADPYAR